MTCIVILRGELCPYVPYITCIESHVLKNMASNKNKYRWHHITTIGVVSSGLKWYFSV